MKIVSGFGTGNKRQGLLILMLVAILDVSSCGSSFFKPTTNSIVLPIVANKKKKQQWTTQQAFLPDPHRPPALATASTTTNRDASLLPMFAKTQSTTTEESRIKTKTKKIMNKIKNKRPSSKKKKQQRLQDYQERKEMWLARYGSLEALQATFGTGTTKNNNNNTNNNKNNNSIKTNQKKKNNFFQGDLTPEQTRRLYHTLLPRSLLGLYEMKLMNPEELAPLAYHARMAAKEYARSRCVWYARVATEAFDSWRSVREGRRTTLGLIFGNAGGGESERRRGGGRSSSSMSWEEIWSKYEAQIVQEECAAELQNGDESSSHNNNKKTKSSSLEQKDLTMRIYLRILEKSCVTNQAFDKMFLSKNTNNNSSGKDVDEREQDALTQMGQQLDRDVRNILLRPKEQEKLSKKTLKAEKKRLKEERKQARKDEKVLVKAEKKRRKREKKRRKDGRQDEGDGDEMFGVDTTDAVLYQDENQDKYRDDDQGDDDQGDDDDNDALDRTLSTTFSDSQQRERQRWKVLRILAGTRHKFRQMLK